MKGNLFWQLCANVFLSCSKLVRWPWHHSIIEISIARRCSSGKMAGTASFMFRLTFLFLVPFFRNDGFSTTGVEGNPDAKRLYDDLLSHYNRLIRPVSNNSQVVTVGLGLHLTQLIDLVCIIFRQKKVFLQWTPWSFFLLYTIYCKSTPNSPIAPQLPLALFQ